MAKFDDILEEAHLKKILTVGGFLALAVGTSYLVRTYLDFLRVKLIRKELKQVQSKPKREITQLPSQENWIIEDE